MSYDGFKMKKAEELDVTVPEILSSPALVMRRFFGLDVDPTGTLPNTRFAGVVHVSSAIAQVVTPTSRARASMTLYLSIAHLTFGFRRVIPLDNHRCCSPQVNQRPDPGNFTAIRLTLKVAFTVASS